MSAAVYLFFGSYVTVFSNCYQWTVWRNLAVTFAFCFDEKRSRGCTGWVKKIVIVSIKRKFETTEIVKPDIQGKVRTHLRCGGIWQCYCIFFPDSASEKIM